MSKTETTDNLTIGDAHKLHHWRMAFFGMVILLAGIVIGGASMLILAPEKLTKPPPGPEWASGRMVGQLQRELRLSPEQAEKIRPILKAHMEALNRVREDARQEIGEALEQMHEQISDILTDGQKRMWERRLHRLQGPLRGGGPRWGNGAGGPRHRGGEQEQFRRGPQEHFRRGPGPFGPPKPPAGPNFPRDGMHRDTRDANDKPPNEDL
ncbi:MAG: hypothetical protein PVJ86_06675 [Phycisphaerales bacterium]